MRIPPIPTGSTLRVVIDGTRAYNQLASQRMSRIFVHRLIFSLLGQDKVQYAAFLIYVRRHARVYQIDHIYTILIPLPTPVKIHITGPPGVGKTTLGDRLATALGPKILVKETEELGREFAEAQGSSFQMFIDEFMAKNIFKPLVFIGDNIATVHNVMDYGMFYNLRAVKRYFIDLDPATLLHQKYKRLLRHLSNSAKELPYLFSHNAQYLANLHKTFNAECNLVHTTMDTQRLAAAYRRQGYIFATRDDIYDRVLQIFV